jgi:Spy/CpxP family protein refolding chaperone
MRKRIAATVGALVLSGASFVAIAPAASAANGPPVGGCNEGFDLVTVAYVLAGTGRTEPDPSMDPNGDLWTCLKLQHTGSGIRASWHDNVIPIRP